MSAWKGINAIKLKSHRWRN